jgi:hypothetical protein
VDHGTAKRRPLTPAARALPAPGRPALAGVMVAGALLLAIACVPAIGPWWGLDGIRSLPAAARLLPVLMALAAGALAWRALPQRWWPVLALGLALAIAFPLRESIHLLGDTWVRQRTIDFIATGEIARPAFADLGRGQHAQPLDNVIGLQLPLALVAAGVPLRSAFSWASLLTACLFMAGAWNLVRRLESESRLRVAMLLAFALAGTLEVFAGYAESGGIVAAATVWLWARLVAPVDTRRRAIVLVGVWCAALLSHRLALALAPALLWRLLGPAQQGDRDALRRTALLACAAGAAAVLAAMNAGGAYGQFAKDLAEALPGPGALGRLALTRPLDVFSILLLVMPLALLAPAFTERAAIAGWAKSPRVALHAIALATLAPAILVFPVAPAGLGPFCDWELAVMPGIVATACALALLTRLSARRRRAALVVVLPVLTLLASGWLAVNANSGTSLQRAEWLATGTTQSPAVRRHVLLYLGYRAGDLDQMAEAARDFDRSSTTLANPRDAMLAGEAWLRAGDPAAARRSLAYARAHGPLTPELAQKLAWLEAAADTLERRYAEQAAQPQR